MGPVARGSSAAAHCRKSELACSQLPILYPLSCATRVLAVRLRTRCYLHTVSGAPATHRYTAAPLLFASPASC